MTRAERAAFRRDLRLEQAAADHAHLKAVARRRFGGESAVQSEALVDEIDALTRAYRQRVEQIRKRYEHESRPWLRRLLVWLVGAVEPCPDCRKRVTPREAGDGRPQP